MGPSTPPQLGPDAPTPVVDSVLTALIGVGRAMRQRVAGDELEPSTFWLLKSIAAEGPLRVTELASCTHLDPSTVSRHASQLDRAGLVERSPDPADGRAQRLQLTEAGQDRLHDAVERRRALLRRALSQWDADDVAQLDQLLSRFVGDLDTSNAELEPA